MNLLDFMESDGEAESPLQDEEKAKLYNKTVDYQTKIRILLAVAAYSYEYVSVSIIGDGDFDSLSKLVDLTVDTRRPDLDKYFRENFHPDTGMWIHKHPEKEKLKELFYSYYMYSDYSASKLLGEGIKKKV